ncbi:MAG: hypothetical protein MI810_09465 [Flavobacteriales bacterium]|jgi:hypothetical protein|nr:hypothetical protein [Flavobacteriales bacterium]
MGQTVSIKESKASSKENIQTGSGLISRLSAKWVGNIEQQRYGIISVLLLWNVCLGGIAVGVGALSSPVQIGFLIFPTMGLLAWILAVQPMKTILSIASVATIIDIVLIVYNLL